MIKAHFDCGIHILYHCIRIFIINEALTNLLFPIQVTAWLPLTIFYLFVQDLIWHSNEDPRGHIHGPDQKEVNHFVEMAQYGHNCNE